MSFQCDIMELEFSAHRGVSRGKFAYYLVGYDELLMNGSNQKNLCSFHNTDCILQKLSVLISKFQKLPPAYNFLLLECDHSIKT